MSIRYRILATLALSSVVLLCSTAYSKNQSSSIRDFDFRKYLISRNGLTREGCGGLGEPIKGIKVAYADLLGDGNEEAIVEATTCAMGNGGADIVEVFRLDQTGNPVSLKIDDSKFPLEDLYKGQFRTPRLQASNGKLIRWFTRHASGGSAVQETKRIITYKWNGDEFFIEKVQDLPLDAAN